MTLSHIRLTSAIAAMAFIWCSSGFATAQNADPRFKVLAFYNGTWDEGHISYARECNRWFPAMAAQYNFEYEAAQDWAKLNADYLKDVAVVMFLDGQPSSGQRTAFEEYMRGGGGFIGYHVVAFNQDPSAWDWYFNQFLGMGSFAGNTWAPTSAVLRVEDPAHPAARRLPETFESQPNEWYSWQIDLRTKDNIDILLSIDPASFPLGTGPKEFEIWHSGYYPVVWANTDYKMLYVNMGHNDIDYGNNNAERSFTFDNEIQNRLIIDALLWMGGVQGETGIAPNAGNISTAPSTKIIRSASQPNISLPDPTLSSFLMVNLNGRITAAGRRAERLFLFPRL